MFEAQSFRKVKSITTSK